MSSLLLSFDELKLGAIIVAALVPFAVGMLWYSKGLFGKPWQKHVGLSDKELKSANMAQIMGISLIANFVCSATLYALLHSLTTNVNATNGMVTAMILGGGLVGMVMLTNYLFERRTPELWLLDVGYTMVALGFMGAVIGALS